MPILLDVDGVMVDLIEGICQLYGTTSNDIKEKWRVTSNNWTDEHEHISPTLGTTSQDIWDKMEECGPDFWLELKEYPWARTLYDYCKSKAPTYFVTAPTPYEGCLRGKLEWMKRFTGDPMFMDYLIGRPKFLCAGRGQNILIDDSKKNCKAFNLHGGRSILFPQYWNGNDVVDPCVQVIQKIEELIEPAEPVEIERVWSTVERPDLWPGCRGVEIYVYPQLNYEWCGFCSQGIWTEVSNDHYNGKMRTKIFMWNADVRDRSDTLIYWIKEGSKNNWKLPGEAKGCLRLQFGGRASE